jgi:starch-binding outer membrane protein, SusD/RagB family
MKKIIIKSITVACVLLATFSSCKKDFPVITGATTEQTFSNPRAVTAVVVGLQRTYSRSLLLSMTDANSLTTNETLLVNSGNLSEAQLLAGGATLDNTNALLGNFWATANKVIYDANNAIIAATGNKFAASAALGGNGYASGVLGYATVLKALGLASLSQFWEKVPDTTGVGIGTTPLTNFSARTAGFARALGAIDNALAAIAANPISKEFDDDLPIGLKRFAITEAPGINIVNILNALKARYNLFLGNYATALSASTSVDITRAIAFNFESANPNPVFTTFTSSNNVIQPIDSTLGLLPSNAPALNDARVAQYTSINATISPRFRFNGFWNSATRVIPIYLPDEMRLIRAECLLRQSTPDPVTAQSIIDAILKQAPGADPFGIAANIAVGYTGASDVNSLLTEVYRNRCIELYFTGLKLEDMRRFNRPLTEMKRRFFPYPLAERNNNPNTPADPPF